MYQKLLFLLNFFSSLFITALLFLPVNSQAQLANGKNKFLGNIIASNTPSNFGTYWNQVTPENASKWGAVESTRDNMNWGDMDNAYNYAKQNGFPFKGHTFVWGSQEPSWIGSLSQSEQRAEVEEWIAAYAQRYPNTDMMDVVNEALHAPASYRNALGGAGSTGWDWIIWSFEKARQYLPNAKLYINDYGIINDGNAVQQYVEIINILKSRGLIDGIGIQCHQFNIDNLAASTIQNNLNTLAATGLPILVSELDITGSDSQQRDRYAEKFPIFWEHSAVEGITLWGYREGETWKANTHLVRSDGSERPSMTWLKEYMGASGGGNNGGGDTGSGNITVRAQGTVGDEIISIQVNGSTVGSFTLGTSYANYSVSGNGTVRVEFTNDQGDRDVQVDYITVDGTTYQAEDQETNTAVYQDGSCGGSYSENMHCGGYIEFGNTGGGNNCDPSTITHYVSINDGSWDGMTSISVTEGDKVEIGPQPEDGGSWSWTGPNGYTNTSRVVTINSASSSNEGNYTATYTNDCGAESSSTIALSVTASGGGNNGGGNGNIVVRARGVEGDETINVQVNGNTVDSFTLSTSYADYAVSGTGTVRVEFTNDQGDRDVQVDYIIVDGTTYQAEDQETNTGVYQDGSCGGSYSEMMHCGGYIEFGPGNNGGGNDNGGNDGGGTTCGNLPEWTTSGVYDATGTQVSYNGNIYENRWYSSGQNPESNSGQWQVWILVGSCNSARSAIEVGDTESIIIDEVSLNNKEFTIYPNPSTSGRFIIQATSKINQLRVFDYNGKLVKEMKSKGSTVNLDLGLARGVYIAHISTEKQVFVKKLIVK